MTPLITWYPSQWQLAVMLYVFSSIGVYRGPKASTMLYCPRRHRRRNWMLFCPGLFLRLSWRRSPVCRECLDDLIPGSIGFANSENALNLLS